MASQEDGWGREISAAEAAYVKPEMKRKWVPFRSQKAGRDVVKLGEGGTG